MPVLQKRQKDTVALKQKTTNYRNQIKEFEVFYKHTFKFTLIWLITSEKTIQNLWF